MTLNLIARSFALALPGLFLLAPAALAQQEGEQAPEAQAEQTKEKETDAPASDAKREALEQYLAGYYAGYSDGYDDGSDDAIVYIVEQQKRRTARRGQSGETSPYRQRAREEMRERKRGEGRSERTVDVSGNVRAKKSVPIRGTDLQHLVVLLTTDDGRRIADLGPLENYENVNIKEGAKIAIEGHPIRARGRSILAAKNVEVDGKTIEVEYRRPRRVQKPQPKQDGGANQGQQEKPQPQER